MKERKDDYQQRREHLKTMSDQELKDYFYELADKIVDPLLELGYQHTSKSIERSILLRMGFSSIESKAIVDVLNENNLLRKGAGHCVYKLAMERSVDIRQAGLMLAEGEGIEELLEVFKQHG